MASVLFCLDEMCGWREWSLSDIGDRLDRLVERGERPEEIARQLGISERTVFRRLRRNRESCSNLEIHGRLTRGDAPYQP